MNELIRKYLEGSCSEEERAEVERLYNSITRPRQEPFEEEQLTHASEESWQKFEQHIHSDTRPRHTNIFAYATAAAVLIIFALGYLMIDRKEPATPNHETVETIADVRPGGNYATLTLANGKQINLSQSTIAPVINKYKLNIQVTNDGEVVYTSSNSSVSASNEMNTIATPRGGQYQVQLSDGSKVWLNAASSLKFPADFKSLKNRTVQLSGEAYFQVAKDAQKPFIVKTTSQEVQVLGTHFNINSYTDEPVIKTTLMEGSVKVTSTISTSLKSAILKPGQEANLQQHKDVHQNDEPKLTVQQANIAAASWKDGMIKVQNAELPAILRQVSRWYNIDIVYKGSGKFERFTGTIPMNTNLSDLIRVLESKDLHLTITANPERQLVVEKTNSTN